MNKNNKKKSPKIGAKISGLVLLATLGMAMSHTVNAQTAPITIGTTGTSGETPKLAVPEYTMADLKAANCDPNVWSTLVTNYLKKRGFERQVQGQIQVADQGMAAPPAKSSSGGNSCWENAMGSLKQGVKSIDQLLSIFTGGINFDNIEAMAKQQISDYACNQLNNYVGKVNYGIRSGVGNVTGGLNDTLGKIGIKNDVVRIDGTDIIKNPNVPYNGTGPVSGAFDNVMNGLK